MKTLETRQSDEPITTGVLLSIPLDEKTHVLNEQPRSDVSQSWSTSTMIVLTQRAARAWGIVVRVLNLGDTTAYAYVDLVVWLLERDGRRRAEHISIGRNVQIPGTAPGVAPTVLETTTYLYHTPASCEVTHFYAVAHDPVFDPLQDAAQRLVQDALAGVVDYSYHPARMSRQVACRTVPGRGALMVKPGNHYDQHNRVGLLEVAIVNVTLLSELRVMRLTANHQPFQTVFADVRLAPSRDFVVAALEAGDIEMSMAQGEQGLEGFCAALRFNFDREIVETTEGSETGNVLKATWKTSNKPCSNAGHGLEVYLIHR